MKVKNVFLETKTNQASEPNIFKNNYLLFFVFLSSLFPTERATVLSPWAC